MPLRLYTVHHLNLAYSSLEEDRRLEVVNACYWPLLRMARELRLPIGLEATAYTLETIQALAPDWIAELRELVSLGLCEFVGSGYAQVIGPLVPCHVTRANLRIGGARYRDILGIEPRVALVNEQAYSSGIVPVYREAGYEAIVMEWENPASAHPEWPRDWQYFPQRAAASGGDGLALIWNHSIAFQQFQRYAHGDAELETFVDYLGQHVNDARRSFCVYGNDVEVFDFRPGRYRTEATREHPEWDRIAALYRHLSSDERFEIVLPSAVLSDLDAPRAGNLLRLETAAVPVPVKKQNKYNITRWAVTGRDDLGINSACWRIYDALQRRHEVDDDGWRELCYLWSSDFRTHVTEKRWKEYRVRLDAAERRLVDRPTAGTAERPRQQATVDEAERFIDVDTGAVQARAIRRRGLALQSLVFPAIDSRPLCGTLPHGYYSDIKWAADFYTGNLVFESPGAHKVTDLEPARDVLRREYEHHVSLATSISTPLGDIEKEVFVHRTKPEVEIQFLLRWATLPLGSLRLGFVLLNPEVFDLATLAVRTHNGGPRPETFALEPPVDHGAPVSHLVSARHALGITEGTIEIGDARRTLRVTVDKGIAALVGMVTCERVLPSYVCRLELSAAEIDDTRKPTPLEPDGRRFRVRISAARAG